MYRAIRPVPKNPTRAGRGPPRPSRLAQSQSAASAADAAVLVALMIELSRQANG